MQIDAKTLRAELVPVTSAALERIKLLLLNMARQATLAVLDDITLRIQQLSARPSQLDDFVSYLVSNAATEGRVAFECKAEGDAPRQTELQVFPEHMHRSIAPAAATVQLRPTLQVSC